MKIQDLTYFICLEKNSSFTLASKELHVAKSTISQAIKRLESELDTKLFVSTHPLRLSVQGKTLLVGAKKIISIESQIKRKISKEKESRLKVAYSEVAAKTYLKNIVNLFSEKMLPDSLDTQALGSPQIQKKLFDGYFDVGIYSTVNPYSNSNFEIKILETIRYKLISKKNGNFSSMNKLSLSDITDQTFVLRKKNYLTRLCFDELCRINNFSPKKIIVDDAETIAELVSEKDYLSFQMEDFAKYYPDLRAIDFDVLGPMDTYLVYAHQKDFLGSETQIQAIKLLDEWVNSLD